MNETWAIDFVSVRVERGVKFRAAFLNRLGHQSNSVFFQLRTEPETTLGGWDEVGDDYFFFIFFHFLSPWGDSLKWGRYIGNGSSILDTELIQI